MKAPRRPGILRRFIFFPALGLGLLAAVLLVKTRQTPEQIPSGPVPRAVRVLPAPKVKVRPRAIGYGTVRPAKVWEAVAEVSGKVVAVHPELEKGSILPEGALLLSIDPREYHLAKDVSMAEVANIEAKLAEVDQKERNHRNLLDVQQRGLDLSEKELARRRDLVKTGAISSSEVDREEKKYLAQKQVVEDLKNSLALIPTERKALQAQLKRVRTLLEDTGLDLGKTEIRAPFDCRISQVSVEPTQFVRAGDVVAKADSLARAEVAAQVPLHEFMGLIGAMDNPMASHGPDMQALRKAMGLTAVVRLAVPGATFEWPAVFSRLSDTLDPSTRTVGVVVRVDEPYRTAVPGVRPPLIKNMYCQVEILGRPGPDRVVVPDSALRNGRVYVADSSNHLVSRPVDVAYKAPGFAALASGLAEGERVVLSDLAPAIEGTPLSPVEDTAALERLKAEATGRAALK